MVFFFIRNLGKVSRFLGSIEDETKPNKKLCFFSKFENEKQKQRREGRTNHECVPRHGGKKLIEQISEAKFIDYPVIAINVHDCLVEVEDNDNVIVVVVSHWDREIFSRKLVFSIDAFLGSLSWLVCGLKRREMRFGIYTKQWRIFSEMPMEYYLKVKKKEEEEIRIILISFVNRWI